MIVNTFEYKFTGMDHCAIEDQLHEVIIHTLNEKYGPSPAPALVTRVCEEWHAMQISNTILDVAALHEITTWLRMRRCPYLMSSTAGSSFILYLLGITMGNPLPSHYYCPKCHRITWHKEMKDGFDLAPDSLCEVCLSMLNPDGHNIPWQSLWGYGEFSGQLCLKLSADLFWEFSEIMKSHWLNERTNDHKLSIQSGDEDDNSQIKLSHLRLNFCLHTRDIRADFYYRKWDRDAAQFCVDSAEYMTDPREQTEISEVIPDAYSFSDLLARYGLIHSAGGSWFNGGSYMVQRCYSLSDMIAFREDVYWYLMDHGFLEKDAWRGMDAAMRGRHLPVITSEMENSRDKWVLYQLQFIMSLCPKAQAVEHVLYQFRAYE